MNADGVERREGVPPPHMLGEAGDLTAVTRSWVQGVYRSFVANSKFVNAGSLPHISFLGACVVELFGLDPSAAYGHAFTHIKELAVLLRGALVSKTADSFRDIYCWQTINCLELWARLLAVHADKQVRLPFYMPQTQSPRTAVFPS